jgi:hypothetical protein
MNVLPYAHPQLFKVFKHLLYVWHDGCGMQFERFYSLNDSVVGSFPHLHHLGFQPALPNLGIPLWWQRYECAAICPSTTVYGVQTPNICMTWWMWDAVWMVLQPQR